MRIKIMFDDKVMMDTEVKSAEISEVRDVVCIYKSDDFKGSREHKPYEIVPSVVSKICIDYECLDKEMPNSEFYLTSSNSLPRKAHKVTTSCPECKKDITLKV